MLPDDYAGLMSLAELEEHLQKAGYDVTLKNLQKWCEPSRNIDFPEPKKSLGIYKFYDVNEIEAWVFLWLKATKNMRGRTDG